MHEIITDPCPNFNGGFAKAAMEVGILMGSYIPCDYLSMP